jgi:hypothetical protein
MGPVCFASPRNQNNLNGLRFVSATLSLRQRPSSSHTETSSPRLLHEEPSARNIRVPSVLRKVLTSDRRGVCIRLQKRRKLFYKADRSQHYKEVFLVQEDQIQLRRNSSFRADSLQLNTGSRKYLMEPDGAC